LAVFLVRRVLVILIVASCAVLFSQAQEFAQQYRQRLAGAIDELTTIIQTFDEQANHAGLDRQTALNVYARSNEDFLRQQGDVMRRSFARYQSLSDQLEDLSVASPILRPLMVARQPDHRIVANVWRDFVPGLPVSVAGLVWCGFGMLIGAIILAMFGILVGMAGRVGRSLGTNRPPRMGDGALQ
jgi:hypothetical protein